MARNSDQLFETENTGGLLSGFLAEEDEFDRRTLWRLGSWAALSVGAVVVALYVNQSSIGSRREQVAAADLARQAQQIQTVAKESQGEARRLAQAIDTLNGDRDRLYSRVTVLEQGLDSVTGSIAKQNAAGASPPSAASVVTAPVVVAPAASTPAAPAPAASAPVAAEPPAVAQNPSPTPAVSPVTTTAVAAPAPATEKPAAIVAVTEPAPAAVASAAQETSNTPAATPSLPLMASKSLMAPPDPAAGKLVESNSSPKTSPSNTLPSNTSPPKTFTAAPIPDVVASTSPADDAEPDVSETPAVAVRQTEFAVDVGGANSVAGLRALWRGLLKAKPALGALRPVIAVKESHTGLGMQLRLLAGPLKDAAAAAKICAVLGAAKRSCETTEFDGQRLAMSADDPPPATKPYIRRRGAPKHSVIEEPVKKPEPTLLSSIFSRR